jgi:signal peptidase I
LKFKVVKLTSDLLIALIKEASLKGLPVRFMVRGFSMIPFIRDRDIVTIVPCRDNALGLGHVVAFMDSCCQKLKIHRVVAIHSCGTQYVVKGDNVLSCDGIVHKDNIFGYITRVERRNRTVALGNGPERRWIAVLSTMHLFSVLLFPTRFFPLHLKKIIRNYI